MVHMGKHSMILPGARIECFKNENDKAYKLIIGDNTDIQQGVHITCAGEITIGNNCAILGYSTITDIIHPYDDILISPKDQKIKYSFVHIGDDSFIGMGARIMPGITIGKHVIVGANAVVTHDIPDYCVATGVPAQIVKKYSNEGNKWKRIK